MTTPRSNLTFQSFAAAMLTAAVNLASRLGNDVNTLDVMHKAEKAFMRSHKNGGTRSGAARHKRAARKLRNVRARAAK